METTSSQYYSLQEVLIAAFEQASKGKGKVRHSDQNKFEDQPILWIERMFCSFQLGQAVKKIHESQALDVNEAINELLGAINYLAAHIIYLRGENNETGANENKRPVTYDGTANRENDSHCRTANQETTGGLYEERIRRSQEKCTPEW